MRTSKSRPLLGYETRQSIAKISANVVLIIFSLLSLYPMALMLVNSFKSNGEIVINAAGWPQQWVLSGYADIFSVHGGLWKNYLIGMIVAGSSTIISVILCAMAAFAFAKYKFKGRAVIFAGLLAMMMIPSEITIPGLYLFFAKLKLLNTLYALILPTITPIIGLFLIRQYMLGIPDALIEAARIDGAGHFTVFWRIMIPTSAPVLGAYAILHYMSVWNSYAWPTIAVQRIELQPIMVVLPQLIDQSTGFVPVWGTIMAGATLATIPILIVFILFQDTFLSSVTIGAVKE